MEWCLAWVLGESLCDPSPPHQPKEAQTERQGHGEGASTSPGRRCEWLAKSTRWPKHAQESHSQTGLLCIPPEARLVRPARLVIVMGTRVCACLVAGCAQRAAVIRVCSGFLVVLEQAQR